MSQSDPSIRALFMNAQLFEDAIVYPRVAMPKLNGIRAMWIPGRGFFSKDGVQFCPGILPTIEDSLRSKGNLRLDGEFYVHGWSLQRINGIVAVNRLTPHELAGQMVFNVFDNVDHPGDAADRMRDLAMRISNMPNVQVVHNSVCTCRRMADAAHAAYLSLGYEGTMYKFGQYRPGRNFNLVKRKGWVDGEFDVIGYNQASAGKYAGSLGAIVCRAENGSAFEVGSFAMDDTERNELWSLQPIPARAKIRYIGRTDSGLPYNATVLQLPV